MSTRDEPGTAAKRQMTPQEQRRHIAENFYRTFCPSDSLDELNSIDYNYLGTGCPIEKGTKLWGFKDPRKSPLHRFSSFFCIPGTPIDILGVHNVGALKTHPKALAKTLNKYEVLVTIPHALESLCAGGIDDWSESGRAHQVAGGGWQYKVPHAHRHVRYVTPFPPPRRK